LFLLQPEILKHIQKPSERRLESCSRSFFTKFAMKCEDAGVDAVVAEGFEAGGHNGRDETTTFCLFPM
jgi:NAD(P)H-dependent flavin oxidoreductase YrpB (nitropropane dioxygenase family)